MLLVNQSFVIEQCDDGADILRRIERAGRTCYMSLSRITGTSASKFVSALIKNGHLSVLEHEKLTVRIICDRAVSHEIIRSRMASYSMESQRYVSYKDGITFIVPCWLGGENSEPKGVWLHSMAEAEKRYVELLNLGWTPQQARSVLPNSTKTELVVTMNLRSWIWFFKQRCSKSAHPQLQVLAQSMLDEFKRRVPVIFDEI